MSRIGKKPIEIPNGVEVKIEDHQVTVKGPNGTEVVKVRPEIAIKIEDNNGKKSYITKGDNNTLEDNEKVEDSQIRGKMVIVIPRIGNFIKLSSNNIIVLILILVVLILWFMKILINEKRESRREKRKIEEAKSKKY